MAEAYSREPYVACPKRVSELDNMRTSIKRLLYSMEFFESCYGKAFRDALEVVIEGQELLGTSTTAT